MGQLEREPATEPRESSSDETDFLDSKRLLEDYGHQDLSLESLKRSKRRSYSLWFIALLASSLIFNIALVAMGAVLYRRRGPSNPLFPQALYCKNHCPTVILN